MKKITFLIIVAAMFVSFSKSKENKFIPPGTVRINDTLFIDKTEITNLSWIEYTCWTKNMYGANSPEYHTALPDTAVWLWGGMNSNEPWQTSYRNIKRYKNYPIVGISYEQALAYCKWRTQMVKYFMAIKNPASTLEFEYRLPSQQEWEFASNGSGEAFTKLRQPLSMTVSATTTLTSRGQGANVQWPEVQQNYYTVPVASYQKNRLGLYDMTGNVAEMIAQRNICKGGSWNHSIEQCRNGLNIPYTGPSAWLGFRCVCIVKHHK